MTAPTFDLVDVIRTIQKKQRFIIIIMLAAMIVAGVFVGVKKKKYKSEAHFLVNNPVYTDRGNLFHYNETRFVDFFGGEDEVDRITALSGSDTVIDRVIRNAEFPVIYRMNIDDPKDHAALMTIFKKNFNIKRGEYKDVEVSYIAYEPQTAANVVNTCVDVLGKTYQHYVISAKNDVISSINGKLTQLNVSIDSLTDSLAAMRDRYGIYSILSPARENTISSGEVKGNGKSLGKGMEEIQNIEAIKDQLVTDRARYISTLNEFEASTNEHMTLVKVITRAIAPESPYGPGLPLTLVIAAFLGLFFSVLYVLIMTYFHKLNDVVR